jgi:hypothetical protein
LPSPYLFFILMSLLIFSFFLCFLCFLFFLLLPLFTFNLSYPFLFCPFPSLATYLLSFFLASSPFSSSLSFLFFSAPSIFRFFPYFPLFLASSPPYILPFLTFYFLPIQSLDSSLTCPFFLPLCSTFSFLPLPSLASSLTFLFFLPLLLVTFYFFFPFPFCPFHLSLLSFTFLFTAASALQTLYSINFSSATFPSLLSILSFPFFQHLPFLHSFPLELHNT